MNTIRSLTQSFFVETTQTVNEQGMNANPGQCRTSGSSAREKYSDLLEKLTGKQIDEMFGDPVTKDTHKKS